MQTAYFAQNSAPSGSDYNTKRKRSSWTVDDFDYDKAKLVRVRSPGLDRRTTFPLASGVNGHAHVQQFGNGQRSDGSDGDMDMDGDADMDGGMPISMPVPMHLGGMPFGGHQHPHPQMGMQMNMVPVQPQAQERQQHNYSFAASGSGGFGFGPGAEEDDEEEMEREMSSGFPTELYPSFTPHTNPNHFSNFPPTTMRPKSPLSAQPFSTSLRAPASVEAGGSGGMMSAAGFTYGGAGFGATGMAPQNASTGLLQPTVHAPLGENATEVEKARAQHGPQCTSIPKLVLSQYPDPVTGKQSMWAMCRDCGAVERSS